ncbi:hypothetical protein [Microbacterium binotii]|uniref:Uncharacterized protein n=1 Tax=Microbacterium binotii TaxID=462710 RepID=A0ABN3P6R0_9MICO
MNRRMNCRIEIRFAPTKDRYVTSVRVTASEMNVSFALYDAARSRRADLLTASQHVETLLRSGTWRISFPEMLDRAPMVYDSGVAWTRLVAFRTDLVIEEVPSANPLNLACDLRNAFASGTCDIESGEFWFDPKSELGSLLVTTPERGHFEVAATLVNGRLVLNPRLTRHLVRLCPAWSEVFDMVAGRLVIMDAALMTGNTIERLAALPVREAVAA